jgi:hypothetical protein
MPCSRDKSEIIANLLRKPGNKALIDANCVECIYDEGESGSYLKQIWECPVSECLFHSVRTRPRRVGLRMESS